MRRPAATRIHFLMWLRALKRRVVATWGDGTPTNWFMVEVAENPRRRTGLDNLEHEPAIARALAAVVVGPRPAPERAPAAGAGAALAEEKLEVVPAVGGERVTDEFRWHD